jgi:hypothetical protein
VTTNQNQSNWATVVIHVTVEVFEGIVTTNQNQLGNSGDPCNGGSF